ncbi:hypothetical protein L7F22_049181 [Adiantum nelumboides]|nr:hypothetical protein [Adiantum nelumboides]
MMRGVNMETLVEWDVNRVVLLVETLCDTSEYSCSIQSHAVSAKALAFMTIEGWLELGVKCLSHRHTLIGWCRTILERAHNQEVSPKSTSTSERNIVNVQGMDALDPSDLHPHAIPITYERIYRPDECKHLYPIVGWRNYKRYKAPEPSEPLPILEVSNDENNLINDPMRRRCYALDDGNSSPKDVQKECEQQEGLKRFELERFSFRESSLNHEHEVESLMPQDQSMAYFTPKHVMLDVSDGEEYEVAPLGTGSLVELITKGLHMPMKDHCEDDSTLRSYETIPKFSSLSEILDNQVGVSKKSLQNQKREKLLKNKTLKNATNVAHPSTFSNINAAQENVLDRGKKYKKSLGKAKGMGECKEITMVDMDIEAMEAKAVEGMHLADIDEMYRKLWLCIKEIKGVHKAYFKEYSNASKPTYLLRCYVTWVLFNRTALN